MPEQNNFPAWYYGPGGQAAVFQRAEDVPAGWADHPKKVAGDETASSDEEDAVTPMGRDEVCSALRALGVEFKKNASTASLHRQLLAAQDAAKAASVVVDDATVPMARDEVEAALKAAGIAYDDSASTEDLYDLMVSMQKE